MLSFIYLVLSGGASSSSSTVMVVDPGEGDVKDLERAGTAAEEPGVGDVEDLERAGTAVEEPGVSDVEDLERAGRAAEEPGVDVEDLARFSGDRRIPISADSSFPSSVQQTQCWFSQHENKMRSQWHSTHGSLY